MGVGGLENCEDEGELMETGSRGEALRVEGWVMECAALPGIARRLCADSMIASRILACYVLEIFLNFPAECVGSLGSVG